MPELVASQARKLLGPHLGTLVAVALHKFVFDEAPKYTREEL